MICCVNTKQFEEYGLCEQPSKLGAKKKTIEARHEYNKTFYLDKKCRPWEYQPCHALPLFVFTVLRSLHAEWKALCMSKRRIYRSFCNIHYPASMQVVLSCTNQCSLQFQAFSTPLGSVTYVLLNLLTGDHRLNMKADLQTKAGQS